MSDNMGNRATFGGSGDRAQGATVAGTGAKVCGDCGVPVRPGDGGRRAFGLSFCSEECIDSYENGRAA